MLACRRPRASLVVRLSAGCLRHDKIQQHLAGWWASRGEGRDRSQVFEPAVPTWREHLVCQVLGLNRRHQTNRNFDESKLLSADRKRTATFPAEHVAVQRWLLKKRRVVPAQQVLAAQPAKLLEPCIDRCRQSRPVCSSTATAMADFDPRDGPRHFERDSLAKTMS